MKENRRKSPFAELNKVDVSKYVEKKGQFNYLSWAYAVRELKKICPDASYLVNSGTIVVIPEPDKLYARTPDVSGLVKSDVATLTT